MRSLVFLLGEYNESLFFVHERKKDIVTENYDIEFLEFREIDSTCFTGQSLFQVKDRERKFISRIGNKHRCFGFVDEDGRVASYIWVAFELKEDKVTPWFRDVSLGVDGARAYLWDCRTDWKYQNRGLYKKGLKRVTSILYDEGADVVVIDSDVKNMLSVKGIQSAGFVLHASVKKFRFLSMYILICKSLKVLVGKSQLLLSWILR